MKVYCSFPVIRVAMVLLLTLFLTGCGTHSLAVRSSKVKAIDDDTSLLDRAFISGERRFDLQLNILNVVQEGEGELKRLKVDYEIVNRSPVTFNRSIAKYYAYFTIYTAEGRELGHQERLYKRIPSGKTVLEKKTIELSIYNYEEINVELYSD